MALIEINDVLRAAVKVGASDIHLKVGSPPVFRVDGELVFIKEAPLVSLDDMTRIASSMMNLWQRERFEKYNEVDLAYSISGLSRFRVNIYQQRGTLAIALRPALREDPDVILVGEMRDLETMEIAMAAAETGHLVLTTLHTLDAQETINRILTIFPPNQHNQIRYQLSQILKSIISQRLVPIADGKGRVPAVEVLIATARIKECISDPTKTAEIRTAIEEGYLYYGMQTFDQCLLDFYKKGMITYDEVMMQATNKDDLALKISGITSGADAMAEDIDRRGKERAKHEGIRN